MIMKVLLLLVVIVYNIKCETVDNNLNINIHHHHHQSIGQEINNNNNKASNNRLYIKDCNNLKLGQYICPDPDPRIQHIDYNTQQYIGCTNNNIALVQCIAADDIICEQTGNSTFRREMPCKWTNGYSLEVALLLSIFFGMFGLDRFYLGYPALGLAKLCTLGFSFIGQLLDIILIASQVVGPADGSSYIIPYYGIGINVIKSNNYTYRLPQEDWNL